MTPAGDCKRRAFSPPSSRATGHRCHDCATARGSLLLGRLLARSDPDRLADYGDVGALPKAFFDALEATFAAKPEQNPQLVADAIVSLIALPHGERPFRTTVDRMGLGDLVAPYNEYQDSLTHSRLLDIRNQLSPEREK